MNPTILGIIGPGFLNQVPTLGFRVQFMRLVVIKAFAMEPCFARDPVCAGDLNDNARSRANLWGSFLLLNWSRHLSRTRTPNNPGTLRSHFHHPEILKNCCPQALNPLQHKQNLKTAKTLNPSGTRPLAGPPLYGNPFLGPRKST